MGFVHSPNLPRGKISRLILGRDCAGVLRPALATRGISVVACPGNPAVDGRLRSHVDLCVLHLGDDRLLVSNAVATREFISELRGLGAAVEIRGEPYSGEYPHDAAMCAAIIGGSIYHNMDSSVLSDDPRLVNVRQGYAKCAVCAVGENAAITSDPGIAQAMTEKNVDVLTISPGHIRLDGFDTGFIGGSSFMISGDTLAFTGTLDGHPDADAIADFLRAHGVVPVYLTDAPLFDIGSGIPIIE